MHAPSGDGASNEMRAGYGLWLAWIVLALGLVLMGGAAAREASDASVEEDTVKAGDSAAGGGAEAPAVESAEPTGEEAWVEKKTGLRFLDLVEGRGPMLKRGDKIEAHYTGWLEDGTRFDSSHDRGQPIVFTLGAGQVIRGWELGIPGMRLGGKRKLVIPPKLGYGSRELPGIPANSTLVFEVEVVNLL